MGVVVLELAIGLLALRSGTTRKIAAWAGIVVSLATWVLAQGFGGIPTGSGTDPNSGLLVALLGVVLLGVVAPQRARAAAVIGPDSEDVVRAQGWARLLRWA
ncbi:MAG: hypothetical protein ACRDYZ_16390 [Acidimicrobiales bacterium]